MKLLLLPLVLVWTRFCARLLRVKSLFPPILWSSCNQALLAFKAKCSGGSSSRTPGPRAVGGLMWGSELSLLWEILWNIIILQFVAVPRGGGGHIEFDYIVSLPLLLVLLWFLLYVFSCTSFLVGFRLFHRWLFCRLLWFWWAHERRWA